MALVLRKAVLPKNVSLLKCIKGRTLVTAANKNNPTPLPAGVFRRSLKDAATLKPLGLVKMVKTKQLQAAAARGRAAARPPTLRRCISCPELIPVTRIPPFIPTRHFSLPRTRPIFYDNISKPKHIGIVHPLLSLTTFSLSARNASLLNTASPLSVAKRGFAGKPPPCCPCGCGCGCLPPPCNTPPKCLQYITGYYYYPYGTWFCGPYHVSGLSCPVSCGCCACGACGPCGPCAKCCCTCCITPSAAALLPMSGATYSTQACPNLNPLIYTTKPAKKALTQENPDTIPNPPKSPPMPAQEALKNARQSLSKFFPFNSTGVALTAGAATATPKPNERASDEPKNLWLPYDKDAKNLIHVSKSDANRSSRQSGSLKWKSIPGDSKKATNTPPFRRFSRRACDSAPSKVSLSPIRHKQPLKQYIWEVVDGPRPLYTQQDKRKDDSIAHDPFADLKFKPYEA